MGRMVVVVVALFVAGCGGGDGAGVRGGRRVLVVVVVDTLRADHVLDPEGAVDTPALDGLAAEGVAFPRAYAHTSWTLPSHAALFSSRPPWASGVQQNGQLVPEDLPLLAPHLAALGFECRAVVSLSSLTPVRPGAGLDRGFASFAADVRYGWRPAEDLHEHVAPVLDRLAGSERDAFLFVHYMDPHEPYRAHGTAAASATVLLDGEPLGTVEGLAEGEPFHARVVLAPGTHRLEVESDAVVTADFLRCEGPDGPLPQTVGWDEGRLFARVENPGDEPVEAELEVWPRERPPVPEVRRRYALEVEHVDRFLGALFAALRERGLWEDALVVLTSDHGEGLGEHGEVSHGLSVFDELLHVPLVVKPPAGHPATPALRAAADGLVRHVDLVPTVLDLLDLPALPGQTGTSLLVPAERLLEAEAHFVGTADQLALFDGRRKLVHVPDEDLWVLFDLERDPDETCDVLDEADPAELAPWRERLERMAEEARRRFAGFPELSPELEARLRALGY